MSKRESLSVKMLRAPASRQKSVSEMVEKVVTETTDWLSRKFQLDRLPEEFVEILRIRFEVNIIEFIHFSSLIDKESPLPSYGQFLSVAQKIGSDEIQRFYKETEKFKEEYDEDLAKTLELAKGGDENSIYTLVLWDHIWITLPFMQKIIANRQLVGDTQFFKNLGTDLGKVPKARKQSKNERMLTLTRNFGRIFNLNNKGNEKMLFNFYENTFYAQGDDLPKMFETPDDFHKQLKRWGLLADTRQ